MFSRLDKIHKSKCHKTGTNDVLEGKQTIKKVPLLF